RSVVDRGSLTMTHYRRIAGVRGKLVNWAPAIARHIPAGERRLWRHTREFTARTRNVVLAAGGFAFNSDMVGRYAPDYAGIRPLGTQADDGNGILLGVGAGG